MSVLVIGAAGAVGKRLVSALAARGDRVIAVDKIAKLPEKIQAHVTASETGVDVRDFEQLKALFQRHRFVDTVWNLAAPLSVETALDPTLAEQVTVDGMRNLLWSMYEARVKKIMFSDSIGSFGVQAPRRECTARWLAENPTQDPGSEYGRQKRACRMLMKEFWRYGGDPRFAILPGILHAEERWGGGTTEYALSALLAAAKGEAFECPISSDVALPMLYIDDLTRGLLALQDAPEDSLKEPERGYCLPGLSFTPTELIAEIRRHVPGFEVTTKVDANMEAFARTWPDTLSLREPLRDLGYAPLMGLREIVETVLQAHSERLRDHDRPTNLMGKQPPMGMEGPTIGSAPKFGRGEGH